MICVGINGFGRIGKNFLRIVMQEASARITIGAVNIGPADPLGIAHSFKYDSVLKTYPYAVSSTEKELRITDARGNEHTIALMHEKDPLLLNWSAYGVAWVLECTGKFTKRIDAAKHLEAGAHGVLISAPAHDDDITIIPGVNDHLFDVHKHTVVSLGSCTTNALVTSLAVLDTTWGIEKAMMTTVHAYTNTQALLDVAASPDDLRRSRAAALNIVPTTTGAMSVIGRIMPSLLGKISGTSLRVPVPTVSLLDLTVILTKPASAEQINTAYAQAANSSLRDILAVNDQALVSTDYQGVPYSATIDTLMTHSEDRLAKIFAWYDNEWGYSCRIKDFFSYIVQR